MPTSAPATRRATQTQSSSDGQLQHEPDCEGRCRQEERQLTRVGEPLDMLLAGEAERADERERPQRKPAEAPFLHREPHEADRREDGDDLRHVPEVGVDGSGGRSREPVGERVGSQDARSSHGCDEEPREHPARHRRDDASARRPGARHRAWRRRRAQRTTTGTRCTALFS